MDGKQTKPIQWWFELIRLIVAIIAGAMGQTILSAFL